MDVIDRLAGIATGSALDAARARRPEARAQAQRSHQVLFAPEEPRGVSLAERHAVGLFVALLQDAEDLAALHAEGLSAAGAAPGLRRAVEAAAAAGRAPGPYGRYPAGPLSCEDAEGPVWRADATASDALGPRLAAALEHAHMLVLHPRDASAEALRALEGAGWMADDIVTLSQIVGFTAFQFRVVAGLRVLANA